MIVVWVNKRNWKTPGPIVNVAVQNAASFAGTGHETHLCIGAGKNSDTETDMRDFYGIGYDPRFRIHRIPRWHMGETSSSLSIFLYAFRLIRRLRHRDKVVVFTRESGFLFFMAMLCRDPGIRGYYELHDFYADLSWMDRKESGFYREKFYEHMFLRQISGLVCITREQQALYREIFPKVPSCAFPLGTRPFRSGRSSEDRRQRRTLMYVGHLHGTKGLPFLMDVAFRLAGYGVRSLFLGGKPEEAAWFHQKAEAAGLGNMIEVISFRPPEDMHRVMEEEASIGAVMLQDTFYNRYLTCPVKALDYLSHGIPAIGSDIPSVREVLDQAGFYVPPDDAERFVQSVLALLDQPDYYAEMVRRTEMRALEISWENRAQNIMAFAARTRWL